MILYTSDIKKIRIKYMTASVVILLFSLVYEHFSHKVYSNYMLFAFAIPLFGLVILEIYHRTSDSQMYSFPVQLLTGAVIWLTMGSIYSGALEIYGTTNHLIIIYWIVGMVQVIVSIIFHVMLCISKKRNC